MSRYGTALRHRRRSRRRTVWRDAPLHHHSSVLLLLFSRLRSTIMLIHHHQCSVSSDYGEAAERANKGLNLYFLYFSSTFDPSLPVFVFYALTGWCRTALSIEHSRSYLAMPPSYQRNTSHSIWLSSFTKSQ